MIEIKQLLVRISVLIIFIMLISCSFLNDDELPPIYFAESPIPISTSITRPTIPAPTPIPTTVPATPIPVSVSADDLIYEVNRIMTSVYSYRYSLEADVFMDAGGIVLPVNMIGNGVTQEELGNNYFATELFGILSETYYVQDGNEIFSKHDTLDTWQEFPGTPIGIIPVDFWQNVGIKLLDLEFNYSDNGHSIYGNVVTLISNDSEASSLLEILGVTNTENIILENLNLQIDISKNNFYVDSIRASFTILNGGQFASEVIGLPSLSGVGAAETLIEIKFTNFDQIQIIDGIQ
tara:strand:+ start:1709 stop:2587 length:879 start_codon:yes stop_codon:yes gene_type:complete